MDIAAKPGDARINGTEGPDVMLGGDRPTDIDGKGGADTICGGPKGDHIIGGRGSDTLIGEGGQDDFGADPTDTVAGGNGTDAAFYGGEKEAGVEVDLAKGIVRSVADLGGGESPGVIAGVEDVRGTDFADELRGGRGPERLSPQEGRDFVDGRGGDDYIHGGPGIDEVSYESAPARVKTVADAEFPRFMSGSVGKDTDTIVAIEIVTGTKFNDSLGGTNKPEGEDVYGGEGDDTIKGEGGPDKLFGGDGNDVFEPGPGDDYVEGGENRPVTGPRQPGDLVNFRNASLDQGEDHMEVHLSLDLPPPTSPFEPPIRFNATGEGNDKFKGVESVRGIENEDTFMYGDDDPNVLVGGNKGDHIEAFGGNDFLFGLGGSDGLYGGDGDDYLKPGDDAEIADGGKGTDTCDGVDPEFKTDCEK